MKILLDIDDTALISKDRGKTWNEHPLLRELIRDFDVYLFSGNPDIEMHFKKLGTKGFIPKGTEYAPQADVLIDNDCDIWKHGVKVKKYYFSIDAFFEDIKKGKTS